MSYLSAVGEGKESFLLLLLRVMGKAPDLSEFDRGQFAIARRFGPSTVGSKIIRALAIILADFLLFDCQLLSFDSCYKQ